MCATRGARSAFSSVLALVLLVSGSPALPLTAAAPTQINTVVATIPVGNHPQGVAYDLGNGYVYVTDGGSRAVSVIDASTNTVVGNVTVGPGPSGIAYDQGNGRIYVTDSLSSSPSIVSVIDGSTDAVVANVTLTAGSVPIADVFNPANGDVYVVDESPCTPSRCVPVPGDVSVIDGSTDTVVANVAAGYAPTGIALASAAGGLYVINQLSNTISVVDGSTNAVVSTLNSCSSAEYPLTGAASDSANGELYVTCGDFVSGGRVLALSESNSSLLANVTVGVYPLAVAFDPSNGEVYAANYGSKTVSVIDGLNNTVVATIPVGAGPDAIAYDSSNGEMFVANGGSGTLSVIETTPPSPAGSSWTWAVLAIPVAAVVFVCAIILRGRASRKVAEEPGRDSAGEAAAETVPGPA